MLFHTSDKITFSKMWKKLYTNNDKDAKPPYTYTVCTFSLTFLTHAAESQAGSSQSGLSFDYSKAVGDYRGDDDDDNGVVDDWRGASFPAIVIFHNSGQGRNYPHQRGT